MPEVTTLNTRLAEVQADRLIRVYESLIKLRAELANDLTKRALVNTALADLEAFSQAHERDMRARQVCAAHTAAPGELCYCPGCRTARR